MTLAQTFSRVALLASIALALASGCVVYTDDHDVEPTPPPNYSPYIHWAEAGCYWDDYNRDFIWWFDAEVLDDNGSSDVMAVFADVYDGHGNFVDTFELYRVSGTSAGWFSDWLEWSTNLDCYYGGYQVDVIAYDWSETTDGVTIYPYTY